ncbi:YqhA family protein [Polaribacter sp. PL03]|uniref:YqhA family protein n=1 Tax=Polaribacter sp. PL03 TaxID=3088353 RepID=UPI0029D22D65|nr:YqhA family protein [Polaribacter sp. PL03]MDX6746542.1 YqhA family protein [Polaribacter sp. PL03]
MVLFIFAHGVYTLFISNKKYDDGKNVLKWIRTPNIGHLKNVLAEVIVIILFVKFLEVVFVNIDNLKWEIIILPISIVLLALGLKFLKLNKEEIEK